MKQCTMWSLVAAMCVSAGLYTYGPSEGAWFLVTAFNIDVERLPFPLVRSCEVWSRPWCAPPS